MAGPKLRPPGQAVMDDIIVRFFLHMCPEDQADAVRFMFVVETAWWYYLDHWRDSMPAELPSYGLEAFTQLMLPALGSLTHLCHYKSASVEALMQKFRQYKVTIPTRGAILLNVELDKVLLQKGQGRNNAWSFPKGKIEREESDAECAAREVREETGYEIKHLIDHSSFLREELRISENKRQEVKLFIIPGIDESHHFAPTVKGEVSEYAWYYVDDLPATHDESKSSFRGPDGRERRFYLVHPFVKALRAWIAAQKRAGRGRVPAPAPAAPGSDPTTSALPPATSAQPPAMSAPPPATSAQPPATSAPAPAAWAPGGHGLQHPHAPHGQVQRSPFPTPKIISASTAGLRPGMQPPPVLAQLPQLPVLHRPLAAAASQTAPSIDASDGTRSAAEPTPTTRGSQQPRPTPDASRPPLPTPPTPARVSARPAASVEVTAWREFKLDMGPVLAAMDAALRA